MKLLSCIISLLVYFLIVFLEIRSLLFKQFNVVERVIKGKTLEQLQNSFEGHKATLGKLGQNSVKL